MGKQLDIENPFTYDLNPKTESLKQHVQAPKMNEKLKNIGVTPETHFKVKQLLGTKRYYGTSIKDLISELVNERLNSE